MNQTQPYAEKSKESLAAPDLAAVGKKRIDELIDIQKELLDALEQTNRKFFDRMQTETNIVTEFATKLTAARSVPETASAFQDLANRHMDMAAEDARRILADAQKIMETGARWWVRSVPMVGREGLST